MSWHSGLCALVFALPWVAGCGESEAREPESAPQPLGYAPCPAESDLGGFVIDLDSEYTSIDGKVFDGVDPNTVPIEMMSASTCRLLTSPGFSCNPRCPTGELCGAGNSCEAAPVGRDMGVVSIEGTAEPVRMTPNARTKGYSAPPGLPHPGFEPGADLVLRASGEADAPFALPGWGITLFEVTTSPIRVDPGAATQLAWTVPEEPGLARVFVKLEINLHGSNTAWIECDFPDNGSAEVPAELIDGLIAEGISGFPTMNAIRRTASSVSIEPGCVEFLVQSQVDLDVTLAGLTSCDPMTPCPEGQLCNSELFCE